jgi:hypothetical protein
VLDAAYNQYFTNERGIAEQPLRRYGFNGSEGIIVLLAILIEWKFRRNIGSLCELIEF